MKIGGDIKAKSTNSRMIQLFKKADVTEKDKRLLLNLIQIISKNVLYDLIKI